MWNFYKAIIRSAVKEFWTATDEVLSGIAVLSFVAILLNRKYGEHVVTAWNGISPWWSVIPIGLLAFYRLLRANYMQFARVRAERDAMLGTTGLAEEDPKVYLEPLNSEFFKTGIIPFDIFNNGQRVNIAHRIRVQPIPLLPSVTFEYVNHLEMNQHKRMLPIIGDAAPLENRNILSALERESNRTGQLGEDFPFEIAINYEDVTGRKTFATTIGLVYSPLQHVLASNHALAAERRECKIIELVSMDVRRLS